MTDEQVVIILTAIDSVSSQIIEAIEKVNKRETIEYQTCPICNGIGCVQPIVISTSTSITCHYCQGAKTVVKSVTK